jgi:hypothetical protein
MILNELKMV